MDNLDMILYICFFAAAVLVILLIVHTIGLAWVYFKTRWERRTKHTPTPWFRRMK